MIPNQRDSETRKIFCSAVVIVIGQASGIQKTRVLKSECSSLLIHHVCKSVFTTGYIFRYSHAGIVTRLDNNAF